MPMKRRSDTFVESRLAASLPRLNKHDRAKLTVLLHFQSELDLATIAHRLHVHRRTVTRDIHEYHKARGLRRVDGIVVESKRELNVFFGLAKKSARITELKRSDPRHFE